VFVRAENLDKVVRYYDSGQFNPALFAYGWMSFLLFAEKISAKF